MSLTEVRSLYQFRESYTAWVATWNPLDEPDPRGPGTISQWGRFNTVEQHRELSIIELRMITGRRQADPEAPPAKPLVPERLTGHCKKLPGLF